MIDKIVSIKTLKGTSYWADRISQQIEFAWKLCDMNSVLPMAPLQDAVLLVLSEWHHQGILSKQTALKVETLLEVYKNDAKSFTVDYIGHAHLDMNWMWGFNETVSIVLDTFRTMLNLMQEYSDFTFSQSQASTYKIVEEYAPEMLDEIRMRVKEGRWEVSASTWTEFDRNMPNGESNVRQYLYAKKYLCDLFHLAETDLSIDFEPDTFGHHARVPDILAEVGVKYYYHCRGSVGESIYRWRGRNGNEILVYREPDWYLGPAVTLSQDSSSEIMKASQMDIVNESFKLYERYGIKRLLQVYGVGDHGGGVTRMDIEGILDMSNWTCFPTIRFSTLRKFFCALDKEKSRFPLFEGELNPIFTGCYTSQSEIKRANHESEKMLYEAEFYATISTQKGWGTYNTKRFRQSWEKVLYNHFHDILPGSCTQNSKEYALGQYQKVFALANTERTKAVRMIASQIDTSKLIEKTVTGKRAFGAGVGYKIDSFSTSPVGFVEGSERVITFFNDLVIPRKEVTEAVLWDWEDKNREIVCKDHCGEEQPLIITQADDAYWQHSITKILLPIEIPPMGYASYLVYSATDSLREDVSDINPRVEDIDEYILENSMLRVQFSKSSLDIISMINKETGEELLREPSGIRYIVEDATKGMTAWTVGRIISIDRMYFTASEVTKKENELRSTLNFSLEGANSRILVSVFLDKDSTSLSYKLKVNWLEVGNKKITPQLSFILYLKDVSDSYLYDVPFGTLERTAMAIDVPAVSWAAATSKKSVVQLTARGKYGFRCEKGSMRLALLRSSSGPDPYPEYGDHAIEFFITLQKENVTKKNLISNGQALVSDIPQVTHGRHRGMLGMNGSFYSIEGPVVVSGVKYSEDMNGIIIRLYETEGNTGVVQITAPGLRNPVFTDFLEIERDDKSEICAQGDQFSFQVDPYGIYTLLFDVES